MSRKSFLNLIENVFAPSVNQAMREDLLGAEVETVALAAETTLELDFTKSRFYDVTLGSQNLTLTANLSDGKNSLKPGEVVFLKITQDGTAARTVTWSTGIVSGETVSNTTNDVDVFLGVSDGTSIHLVAVTQTAV